MKIALISAEYPNKEIPIGGIGTYTLQLAQALAKTGHYVEVFCGSFIGNSHKVVLRERLCINNVLIPSKNTTNFKHDVVSIFFERHNTIGFDVIESPEYGADAIEVKKRMPSMPLVVKLHTPSFITSKFEISNKKLKRFFYTYWFKPIKKKSIPVYNKEQDDEYQVTRLAEIVSAPSQFIIDEIQKEWDIKNIYHNPNMFEPTSQFLNIRPISKSDNITITFIGSLCQRKGIDVFLEVIPRVVKVNKDIHFQFIGTDNWGRRYQSTAEIIFKRILPRYKTNFHFVGAVPLADIPNYLAKTDVVIFPSVWENSPYVCLEAMSAGLFVIGSKNSGMLEMLEDGGGILIDPTDVDAITKTILKVIRNIEFYKNEGLKGRAVVKTKYHPKTIVKQHIDIYQKAISIACNNEDI